MFWSWLWLSCSSSTTTQNAPQKGVEHRVRILAELPFEEQELKALIMLRENPEDYETLCAFVSSQKGKETCQTYASRPHLWTISSQNAPKWAGGFFFERILFPDSPIPSVQPYDTLCKGDERCLFTQALTQARIGAVKKTKELCASLSSQRQRWECMFQSSEKIEPPDYKQGVELCLQSGSFAPECHNHLVLRLVQHGWLNPKKHDVFRQEIVHMWKEPSYSSMLLDVYWSALASRVLGVTQPFSVEDVPVASQDFVHHLHSAIALRVIFSKSPFALAKKSTSQTVHLNKAHGPNSPVFQPKRVWNGDTEHTWIHFCDIRGGIRPTTTDSDDDIRLALMTAAMMTIPPKIQLVEELAIDGSPVIIWAKEQLLSTKK